MRERILEIALEAYTSKPPHEVTVEYIAKSLGVSKSLIFYYFKSKDELERQLVRYVMYRYMCLAARDLKEFIFNNLRLAEQKPGLYRFLQYFFEKEKSRGTCEMALELFNKGFEKLKEILEKMNVRDADTLAILIMAMIDGLAMYAYLINLEVSKFTDSIIELIEYIKGLRK